MQISVCRQRLLCTISLLLVIVLSACGGSSTTKVTDFPAFFPGDAQVPVTGPTVDGVQSFDAAVSSVLKKWNIPGAALAITKDGKLVLARGYGYADFENK